MRTHARVFIGDGRRSRHRRRVYRFRRWGTEAVVEAIGRPARTLNLRGCEDELDVRVDVAVGQRHFVGAIQNRLAFA